MRTKRYAQAILAALLFAVIPAAAQYGLPGVMREPSMYDQATRKSTKTNFGPVEEYGKGSDSTFGTVLIRVRHVMDFSRLSRMSGGKINAEDIENQVIEFRYPFDGRIEAYKRAGEEEKSKNLIHELVSKPFLAAHVVSGEGKGVSLRKAPDGKYVLWSYAPAAFGSSYEEAGLVVKGTDEFLFARNLRDDFVTVYLAPDQAERHYADGKQETLSASSMESAMMRLPLFAGIAGVLALVLGAVFIKRRRPQTPNAHVIRGAGACTGGAAAMYFGVALITNLNNGNLRLGNALAEIFLLSAGGCLVLAGVMFCILGVATFVKNSRRTSVTEPSTQGTQPITSRRDGQASSVEAGEKRSLTESNQSQREATR